MNSDDSTRRDLQRARDARQRMNESGVRAVRNLRKLARYLRQKDRSA